MAIKKSDFCLTKSSCNVPFVNTCRTSLKEKNSSNVLPNIIVTGGPGLCARFCGSPRALRLGVRTLVVAKDFLFSAPVQTGRGALPFSYTLGTRALSEGQTDSYLSPFLFQTCQSVYSSNCVSVSV